MSGSEADRRELAALTAQLLDRESPPARARALIGGDGPDRPLWAVAVGVGWSGMHLPAAVGGGGGSLAEAAVVLEELGAHLAVSPLAGHVVAGAVLSEHPCPDGALLEDVASGRRRATVALTGPAGRYRTDALGVRYHDDGEVTLTGSAMFVPDAVEADMVLVAAGGAAGPRMFAVDTADPRVTTAPSPTVDVTRRLGTLALAGLPVPGRAELDAGLPAADRGVPAYQRAVDLGALAASCDALGVGRRALEQATGYALARRQFGRPIGSFQAVKHLLADMLVAVEASRAAVDEAALLADAPGDPAEGHRAIAVAASYARDACAGVAAGAMQVHGGIGFTWEHDAHLLVKRAKLDQQLFGSPRWHRGRLADSVFGPVPGAA